MIRERVVEASCVTLTVFPPIANEDVRHLGEFKKGMSEAFRILRKSLECQNSASVRIRRSGLPRS
jgi:hypothetical protein